MRVNRDRREQSSPGAGQAFLDYREARATAALIAERDSQNPDVVFSDAMHVAVALALEDAGIAYTGANVSRMFDRISPAEVRVVLWYRRHHAEEYMSLPMAGTMNGLDANQIALATAVANNFTSDQLHAFFFGEISGTA